MQEGDIIDINIAHRSGTRYYQANKALVNRFLSIGMHTIEIMTLRCQQSGYAQIPCTCIIIQ